MEARPSAGPYGLSKYRALVVSSLSLYTDEAEEVNNFFLLPRVIFGSLSIDSGEGDW